MFSRTASILFVISAFCTVAAYALPADQPPASKDSKTAAPAQESAKQPAQPQQKAPGVVVFIDPATGKIRQPDASEIGGLAAPGSVPIRTPDAPLLQGPGGAVGVKLGEDSLTYMVVTRSPDGKLDMDCVTGDKAANARVTPKPEVSPKVRAGAQVTQDTHDVKAPR